jgi:hypothetical protein
MRKNHHFAYYTDTSYPELHDPNAEGTMQSIDNNQKERCPLAKKLGLFISPLAVQNPSRVLPTVTPRGG